MIFGALVDTVHQTHDFGPRLPLPIARSLAVEMSS